MNTKLNFQALLIVAASFIGMTANAAEKGIELDFNLSASVEQDSNVSIAELDTNSGEADTATVLQAGAKLKIPVSEHWSLRGTYGYTDTAYREFSEYDLGLHQLGLEAAFSSRYADAGILADRYEGILDGEDYLSLTRVSPNLSKLVGSRLFLRGAYIDSRKEYDSLPTRNADGSAVRLDGYLLLDGMDRYLSVSVQSDDEDAVDPELDYEGMTYSLGYGHKMRFSLMRLHLKARLRLEDRDYLDVTQSIGAKRSDQRWRGSLTAAIPFSDMVKLEGSAEHTDNRSNLESAVIDKWVYRLGLSLQF